MSDNEMQEIARAAFYVTDIARGCLGEFKIEGDDARKCYQEVYHCLAALDGDGWKRDEECAMRAPYTDKIKRTVLKKKFPAPIGKRWVTVVLAEFLGIDCTFTALDREPWD